MVSSDRLSTRDPVEWLTEVMVDPTLDLRERKDAAKALLRHKQAMAESAGKKEQKQAAASEVAAGRFRPQQPPQLRAVK